MSIADLLQIREHLVGDYSVQAVDSRELALSLGSKRKKHRDWCLDMVDQCDLQEGVDFVKELSPVPTGGRPESYYIFTLDAAKYITLLFRGEASKQVMRYFLACEKQVQTHTQQLSERTTQQAAIEDFTRINELFARQLSNNGYSQGEIRKNTLLTGIEYQKKTGISVLAPMLLLETGAVNSTDLTAYEGNHAALSDVGGTVIRVSEIASRYKYVTSKMVNDELATLGYQRNHDNLGKKYYWVKTVLGDIYCTDNPLCSGPYKGLKTITGWKFDAIRFPNFYNVLHSRLLDLEARLILRFDEAKRPPDDRAPSK